MQKKITNIITLFLLLFAFIFLSYITQKNIIFFEKILGQDYWGIYLFMLLNIIGIVIAPVTVLPSVVIITKLWGGLIASISVLIAWTIGALIAFLLARKIGKPLIKKFISIKKLNEFENKFSFLDNFLGIFLLRMVIPVEILSYGFGLFSKVNLSTYLIASILGFIPVSFIFGYFGIIDLQYQIIFSLIILIIFLSITIYKEITTSEKNNNSKQ